MARDVIGLKQLLLQGVRVVEVVDFWVKYVLLKNAFVEFLEFLDEAGLLKLFLLKYLSETLILARDVVGVFKHFIPVDV